MRSEMTESTFQAKCCRCGRKLAELNARIAAEVAMWKDVTGKAGLKID